MSFFPIDEEGIQRVIRIDAEVMERNTRAGNRLALGADDAAANHLVFHQAKLDGRSGFPRSDVEEVEAAPGSLGDKNAPFRFLEGDAKTAVRRRGTELL